MKKIIKTIFVSLFAFYSSGQFWDISNPIKLPGTVNTAYAEESIPVFSKDSSILYFVRTYDPNAVGGEMDQDIWFSRKDAKGNYGNCEPLNDLNNKYHNAVLGLGSYGTSMYVLNSYEGKKDYVKGLSNSKKENSKWTSPVEINIPSLDIEGEYYGFHVNENEDVIIISYLGPNSKGEEDLYVSLKQNGNWSTPIHMGNELNSSGYEISPFLGKTQDTLFFSSNGFEGFGDADIFYAVRQGSSWTSWSDPVNLGEKINSSKFDAYFSHTGSTLYWSSNRESERSDIYMAKALTPPPIAISCAGKDVSVFNGNDGSLSSMIEGGVEPISILWSNGASDLNPKNIVAGTYTVTATDAIGQQATCQTTIIQPELVVNQKIVLPEVRYIFNQWTFVIDSSINSKDSLEFLYSELVRNPNIVIELNSHTDSRGSNLSNQKLSENRARACYKYLVEQKGIDPRRIIPVGKGELLPRQVYLKDYIYMVNPPSDMTNVKVITLTESYINQFQTTNKELFKQLHQLNRRTECTIISTEFNPTTAPDANKSFLNFVSYPY
jgi:outer membrane protein OmpA-like peptidoglycan-associated protein